MKISDATITRPQTALQRRRGSDYADLLSRVRQAGLLDRRPTYYAAKIAANALLVVAGWTIFLLLGDSWWQLAAAMYLAVVFAQTGFLGHDAGHRQIFGPVGPTSWSGCYMATLLWTVTGSFGSGAQFGQQSRGAPVSIAHMCAADVVGVGVG